jgi:hypothetical protein
MNRGGLQAVLVALFGVAIAFIIVSGQPVGTDKNSEAVEEETESSTTECCTGYPPAKFQQLSPLEHLSSARSLLAGTPQFLQIEAARLHLLAIPADVPQYGQATNLLTELRQREPYSEVDPLLQTDRKADAIAAIQNLFLAADVPDARLVPSANQFGDSLNVYVQKGQFESIPFPDRKGFIEEAGKLWCTGADGACGSLNILDIRTGERFGKYSCKRSSVSLP